jgi:LysR family transcriptional regulator, nitrogen assimilation regulatory protein
MAGNLDLRRLRYFVKVAELGSLTRAAEALHVAQPALSQHMRSLEAEVGVKLLARGPRGVALTEAGQRMLGEARAMLLGAKSLVERVRGDSSEPEGEVVIGVGQTVGSILMVPLLELAAKRFPRVRIQIREMLSGLLPELVRSGAVDFAISYNTASGNGVEAITVLSEEMCLVGQRRLAERYLGKTLKPDVPVKSLAGLPLYLSRRTHILRELIERVAREKKVVPVLLAEVDSLYIMKELALGGTGFCVLSRANVRRELEHHDLHVARIVSPVIRRDICLVRRSGVALARAAREMSLLAVDVLAGMVKDDVWRGTLQPNLSDIRKSF